MRHSPQLIQLGALVSGNLSPQDIPHAMWPAIINLALVHGLAPMLLWTVKQSSSELITEPLWTPVVSEVRNNAIRYLNLEDARTQVSSALEEAHIPALWLKGIALAHTIYPQPVLRGMGDLDVLVPFDQREDALQVVEGLGYNQYETDGHLIRPKDNLRFNWIYHYHLRGGIHDTTVLELHFQLLSTDETLLPLKKLPWFWTQTTRTSNGSDFTILRPEAHLLYLSAHAILQHGESDSSLRQYFDIHQLILHSPIDWDKVIEQAKVLGWSYATERALTLTTRYFSTPIPDTVLAKLQNNRAGDISLTRAMRRRNKGAHWENILIGFQGLSFTQKIALGLHIILPPRAYMRSRYGLRSNQVVWPHYLYRWFDQGREIAWAVWNRIRNR